MVEDNIIDIKQGRHILQEMTVPAFIANDALLVGGDGPKEAAAGPSQQFREYPAMLLLTGPNNSGKSIFLKQTALIAYMAQVGSYVPAQRATIGITDRIMTRVTSRETVSRGQSAFIIDLQQMSTALKPLTSQVCWSLMSLAKVLIAVMLLDVLPELSHIRSALVNEHRNV